MEKRYYLDSSAYVCILVGEQGHEALARELKDAALVSSTLLPLEVYRALVRFAREGRLSAERVRVAAARLDDDLDGFQLRDLTVDVALTRLMPALQTPRSLDLAHIYTALTFHREKPLTRFVSLDKAQTLAARELGLPV